jgi:hypothetical protein
VTSDAVQRFADHHLGADSRRVVVAGQAEQFGAALRVQAPALMTVKQEALDLEHDGGITPR